MNLCYATTQGSLQSVIVFGFRSGKDKPIYLKRVFNSHRLLPSPTQRELPARYAKQKRCFGSTLSTAATSQEEGSDFSNSISFPESGDEQRKTIKCA